MSFETLEQLWKGRWGVKVTIVAKTRRGGGKSLCYQLPALLLDGLTDTLAFLERHRGDSGIIYCGTRKQVDHLTAALNASRWSALPYHAGLDDRVRRRNQDRFIRDEVPIMVATIAFGLGINKSNVRFILHYHLPKELESYYQEIGRAGRDGLPADRLLLDCRADAVTIRHFIDQGAASERPGRHALSGSIPILVPRHSQSAPPCRNHPSSANTIKICFNDSANSAANLPGKHRCHHMSFSPTAP